MNRLRARAMLAGLLALARGDAGGMAAFEETPEALLRSLFPWLAFALLATLASIANGTPFPVALADAIATVCIVLLPLVLTHAYAVRVNRLPAWPRYATAVNWCNWALPLAFLVLHILAVVLSLPQPAADGLALVAVSAFGLWLHVVIARHGLKLGLRAAIALVAATEFATGTLLIVHSYLGGTPA